MSMNITDEATQLTLGGTYEFSTIIPWRGRVNYNNLKLINQSIFDSVSAVPNLVQALEAARKDLPEHLQNVDFRVLEYLTFKEERYDATSTNGITSTNLVVPVIFISEGLAGLTELSIGDQPTIYVTPKNRAEYNLLTSTLRDLNIRFDLQYIY